MNKEPLEIKLNTHVDDRGFLIQIFGNFEFKEIKRIYIVGNFSKGIIRGLHMHKEEYKAYFVIKGSAKFVTINSNNIKQIKTFVLSEKKPVLLIIPPFYYHGWISLTDDTILIGLSNKTLEESLKDDYRVDPFTFSKEIWRIKER